MRVNKENNIVENKEITKTSESEVVEAQTSETSNKEKKSFLSIFTKVLFGLIGVGALLIIIIAIFFKGQ